MKEIDPDRLYSFSEACQYVPSVRGGHIHAKTLWVWFKQGRFAVEYMRGFRRKLPFIRGSEILPITQTEKIEASAPLPRSKRERDSDYRRAAEELEKEGLKVRP